MSKKFIEGENKFSKKSQKVKVKENPQARTTKVIKKQTFCSHRWMSNISCHHKSKNSTQLLH
jgi:hypothetical protein